MKDRIDALLDEMGITPGEWKAEKQQINDLCKVNHPNGLICMIGLYATDNALPDALVMAQSREMLKALIISLLHIDKSCDEVEGCPYDNCVKHNDGTVSCKYEDCIHYLSGDMTLKAINSATPDGWDWDRIKSYLENCG